MKPDFPPPPPRIPDHELVRRIGAGSYGEIWLGRNVLGSYRAIKIVYRDRFESDGPFEREFRGIRAYAPLSLSHVGLVPVLQVGRDEPAGYFYYIMELADDESGAGHVDPETYSPRTLSREIRSRGSLPVQECVKIGMELCQALTSIHDAGLVHRDVKPANIIFVRGTPKLADIGLVAEIGEGHTFVGTQGYMPPEGPGQVTADIFALGMVLYEISTGKNRQDFPELPSNVSERGREFLELNAIILRACQSHPEKRYPTAEAMAADLMMVQRGQSVRRLRSLERQWKRLSRSSMVILAGLLVAGGAFGIAQLWQKIPMAGLAWGAVGVVSVLLTVALFDKLRDSFQWLRTIAKRRAGAASLRRAATPKKRTEARPSRSAASSQTRLEQPTRSATGGLTRLANQTAPTAFFSGTEWREIAALKDQDRDFILERAERRVESVRRKVEDEYATLSKQAGQTYQLSVACALVGLVALVAAMIAMLLNHVVQGISVAALAVPVFFVMTMLNKREGHYHALATVTNKRLDYYDEFLFHLITRDQQTRLVGMIREKVEVNPYLEPTRLAASTYGATTVIGEAALNMPDVSTAVDEGETATESRTPLLLPAAGPTSGPDDVRFSGFTPPTVLPDAQFVLDVWAYLESQREEVLKRATRGGRMAEAGEVGPVPISRGVELHLHLHMPGFEIVIAPQNIFWNGQPANASFVLQAGTEVKAGIHPGWIHILREGVPIALLIFEVQIVAAMTGETGRQMFDGRKVQNAFASYSTIDRADVLLWVSGARTFGVDVAVDVLDLRAGENWNEKLLELLKTKDLFCLFWSKPASESPEVEKEWRAALRERGIYYIHPVPFADPRDVVPPDELKGSKHFNDLILRMWEYERKRKTR